MMRRVSLMMAAVFAVATAASAGTILVDIGQEPGSAELIPNSNGLSVNVNGATYPTTDAADTNGVPTTIDITHSGWSTNSSSIGLAGPYTGDAAIFDGVTKSFYATGTSAPVVTLSDLLPNATYDLVLFSAKSTTNRRASVFTIDAGNGQTVLGPLNATNNLSEVVSTSGLIADANGQINITVTKGPDTTDNYFYFSAMQITENVVPEPASMSLLGLGGLTALIRRRRR